MPLVAEWMTIRGVAQQLLLSEKTVRRAIRDGQLRATRFRSAWRIRPEDVEAWGAGCSGVDATGSKGARSAAAVGSAAALRAIERGTR